MVDPSSASNVSAQTLDLAAAPAWQRLVLEGGLDYHYRHARRNLAELVHNTPP